MSDISTVFKVANVSPAKNPLSEVSYRTAVEKLLRVGRIQQKVEACSQDLTQIQLIEPVGFHPLVAAFHKAYDEHRPLCLSPDMMWLAIAQGLANHINANAEQLRPKFVKHQGKVPLKVRRDNFIKESLDNNWAGVFAEFSAKIREHIGETTHDLIVPTFSTTGLIEKAASEIVLLDAMQSYFSYGVSTTCGIPQIKLEGTVADWQQLLKQTKELAQFDLEWWIDRLIPVLGQFVLAAKGKPNEEFWRSAYKLTDPGSGDAYITGWITAFFPYLKSYETGKTTRKQKSLSFTTEEIPSGLAKAPFEWRYYDTVYDMEFLGGFVGIRQDLSDLFLRPEIGWVILEISRK